MSRTEITQRWRDNHREQYNEYMRQYRNEHREYYASKQRKYRDTHLVTTVCETCGMSFEHCVSEKSRHYCSLKCAYQSLERSEKLRQSRLGMKASESTRRKLRLAHIGLLAGEKNPSWNGGTKKIIAAIRALRQYEYWRSVVIKRDNSTCQRCGSRQNLVAHHTVLISLIVKEHNISSAEDAIRCDMLWDTSIGVTLCKDCHRKEHNYKTTN